jgi:hypothetical protein
LVVAQIGPVPFSFAASAGRLDPFGGDRIVARAAGMISGGAPRKFYGLTTGGKSLFCILESFALEE